MKYFFVVIGFGIVGVAFALLLFVSAAWTSHPAANAPVLRIEVSQGAGAAGVASILVEKNILTSAAGYRLYSMFNRNARKPKPGKYGIEFGTSYRDIANMLALGPGRQESSIRVQEGWTIQDIIENLAELNATSTPADFLVDGRATDFPFLKGLPSSTPLEGYLFPDTYRVWQDQLPQSLITRQLAEFASKTDGFAEEARKQGRSFYDVVILASIIEKEAGHDEERPLIAGVFMNRLNNSMRLQSDATLNYIIRSGRARLTNDDLKNASLYNTYTHDGLPPGPISNPSLASLEAALHPAKTDYFYFLADTAGKTYFAKTLDEHNANKYRAYGK
ncbi:MAG: endolytic transglycosylase MltG [Patescibacteria group bacterium]